MAINVEVCITNGFRKAPFGDIDRRYSVSIAHIDLIWGDADVGAVLLVKFVDRASFISDIGMIVKPKGCCFREERSGNVRKWVKVNAVYGKNAEAEERSEDE